MAKIGDVAGDIARSMAAAPQSQTEKKAINPISKLFCFDSFTLPNKTAPFPANDDGTVTTRKAYAHFKTCDGLLSFRASVYETAKPGSDEYALSLAMPSSGKGFPQPVFSANGPDAQNHYDAWREMVILSYEKWAESLNPQSVQSSAGRIVRKRPIPVTVATV